MPISLDFETSHHYNKAIDGIDVPIAICIGKQSVELLAKLDTSAAHCIFERKYAEMLGLDVESGRLQPKNGSCDAARRPNFYSRKCLREKHLSPVG